MPTYDYKCETCGHQFEVFHSITAAPVRVCPACGLENVNRLLTGGSGLIFKGSGFYSTDYKSKKSSESDVSKSTAQSTDKKE